MSKGKENAAPRVATTGSGCEAERCHALCYAAPHNQYTLKQRFPQGPVSSMLLLGKENALPGREIRRILKLRLAREVTAQVEQERRRGSPICASCDCRNPGYYLPDTPEELEKYIRSLEGRIHEVEATRDALEEALCKWTGQVRL